MKTTHITYYPTSSKFIKETRINGYRSGSTCVYDTNNPDQIISTLKYKNGCFVSISMSHNYSNQNADAGYYDPCHQTWSPFGDILELAYKNRNEKYHNLNGPAKIKWFANGRVETVFYKVNGHYYNPNGPVMIQFYEYGTIHEIILYHTKMEKAAIERSCHDGRLYYYTMTAYLV